MKILNGLRKQVAGFSLAFMIASMFAVSVAQAATFTDVHSGDWFYPYVEDLAAQGILDTSKDMYRPGDLVNRAEMAKLVVVAFDLPMETADSAPFKDVPLGMWFTDYVATAVKNGVVGGYKDGTGALTGYYGPNDPVTREQAMKMLTLGAPLPTNTAGGPHFPDVSLSQWSYEYVETGYNWSVVDGYPDGNFGPSNNINRAEIAKMVSNAMDPVVRTDEPPVAEPGDLTVALDGTSPDQMDIPKNGSNVLFAVFSFKASANEDVRIEQLILTREGLGLPGDFDNVKLYVDGVQMGGEKTINTTENTATFNLSSDPIMADAGSFTLVEARADLDAAENSQNKFCINSADDVTAIGDTTGEEVSVGGVFAVCGEAMTTTSADVGTLTYKVSQPSTAEINVGDTDVIMTKLRLDADAEDIVVDRITFKQMGSADAEDFGNPTLVLSGTPLDVEGMWEGDYLTFDLTEMDTDLEIDKGSSRNLELWMDVVGGLGNDASFDIYRDWHIEGTGQVYHYGVNVEEDGGSITPTDRDIVGGNIAFSLSSNNPVAGEVAVGANDHEFTRFNISTAGDAVTVRMLTLTVTCAGGGTADEIEDVKIWGKNSTGEWVVVAGPDDVTACGDLEFTDSFDVPGASTNEFIVTGDLTNDADAGDEFDIDVADVTDPSFTELEYTADGDPVDETTEVSGGILNGNVQTVAEPSVDVSLASNPSDKEYVKNTNDRDLVAFDFQASTADDIKVTAVTVSCYADDGSDPGCADAFQTLNLYLKDGSTLTLLDGPNTMTDEGGGDGTAVFSFTQSVLAGNTERLLVRGNVASAADPDLYYFEVTSDSDVTAEDTEGADADVTFEGGGAAPTDYRTVEIVGNGILNNQLLSETSTHGRILVGTTLMQPVLKVRFSADQLEDWYVRRLQIEDSYWCSGGANTDKIYLQYNDGVGTYTASTTMNNDCDDEANFNLPIGHYIKVPANGNTVATVLVDMNDVTDPDLSNGSYAGDLPRFDFDADDNFEAVGASSAETYRDCSLPGGCGTVGSSAPGGDHDGEIMRVARSAPTLALAGPSAGSLANGTVSLFKWTVKADATDDLSIKQFGFNFSGTDADGGGELEIYDFKLFRDGSVITSDNGTGPVEIFGETDTDADGCDDGWDNFEPTGSSIFINDLLSSCGVFVAFDDSSGNVGEETIDAGKTVTYELKATIAGVETSDSVSTELMADTSGDVGELTWCTTGFDIDCSGTYYGLVWSDLSDSPHSPDSSGSSDDWLDGYLVEGQSSLGTVALSKS